MQYLSCSSLFRPSIAFWKDFCMPTRIPSKCNAIPKRTEIKSHGYPSKFDLMMMMACLQCMTQLNMFMADVWPKCMCLDMSGAFCCRLWIFRVFAQMSRWRCWNGCSLAASMIVPSANLMFVIFAIWFYSFSIIQCFIYQVFLVLFILHLCEQDTLWTYINRGSVIMVGPYIETRYKAVNAVGFVWVQSGILMRCNWLGGSTLELTATSLKGNNYSVMYPF